MVIKNSHLAAVAFAVAAVALAGCGPSQEQLALEAQVQELTSQLEASTSKNAELEADVATLEGQNTDLKTRLVAADEARSEAEGRVAALEAGADPTAGGGHEVARLADRVAAVFVPAVIGICAAELGPGLEQRDHAFLMMALNVLPTGVGLIVLGAFGATLVFAIGNFQNAAGLVPWIFLAACYLLHTTGELCLSPIGLSMVTKLAAEKETGMAMGGWFLSIAMAQYVAGIIAAIASGGSGDGHGPAVGASITQYSDTYWMLFLIGLGFGVVYLVMAPMINKLMHGVK